MDRRRKERTMPKQYPSAICLGLSLVRMPIKDYLCCLFVWSIQICYVIVTSNDLVEQRLIICPKKSIVKGSKQIIVWILDSQSYSWNYPHFMLTAHFFPKPNSAKILYFTNNSQLTVYYGIHGNYMTHYITTMYVKSSGCKPHFLA